ncbi:MAG: SH3 domain-containing protein [Candidatus Bipolaricaulota bacterium]|nr:SH3 domain-containing protein [Candidatus Bipolaricaulota bacterium]MCX7844679.1 SH3 domain-containing protein [Candidatus Bipolaricaulota bacterium]MDW8152523.1 SH3 domain-containing protein [Candidatus Bipolaricaulota bacterium]
MSAKVLRASGMLLVAAVAGLLAGCAKIQAQIEDYSPKAPVQVQVGEVVPLRLSVVNAGNRTHQFLLRATLQDERGQTVGKYEAWVTLKPGERAQQTWNHPVAAAGAFTLQFSVWKDTTSLLDVKPATPQVLVTGRPAEAQAGASGKFKVGDRVRTTVNLKVRTAPGVNHPEVTHVNYRGSMAPGIEGQIVDGPKSADGYTWWKVKFITGVEGWCAEGRGGETWLEKVSG